MSVYLGYVYRNSAYINRLGDYNQLINLHGRATWLRINSTAIRYQFTMPIKIIKNSPNVVSYSPINRLVKALTVNAKNDKEEKQLIVSLISTLLCNVF